MDNRIAQLEIMYQAVDQDRVNLTNIYRELEQSLASFPIINRSIIDSKGFADEIFDEIQGQLQPEAAPADIEEYTESMNQVYNAIEGYNQGIANLIEYITQYSNAMLSFYTNVQSYDQIQRNLMGI